jgi:hypothetical protein
MQHWRTTQGFNESYMKAQEEKFAWGHPVWFPSLPRPPSLQVMLVLMVRWRESVQLFFAQTSTGVALPYVTILDIVSL